MGTEALAIIKQYDSGDTHIKAHVDVQAGWEFNMCLTEKFTAVSSLPDKIRYITLKQNP